MKEGVNFMTGRKLTMKQERIQRNALIATAIIYFLLGIGFSQTYHVYIDIVGAPETVNIPSSQQIHLFCQEHGYKFGWLSSTSCDINEVMCYKPVLDMDAYDCLSWD